MSELFGVLAEIFKTAGVIGIFFALCEKGLRIIINAISGKERFF